MLSDRLVKLRKVHNYTQQRVADYLGITRPAYTAYERGTRQPDYETLLKLADYYDVTIDYLLGRVEQSSSEPLLTVTGPNERPPFKDIGVKIQHMASSRKIKNTTLMDLLKISQTELLELFAGNVAPTERQAEKLSVLFDVRKEIFLPTTYADNKISVSGQEVTLSEEEYKVFKELKKHPVLFHDLSSNPEKKVKELIKLYKMKKIFLEDDDEDYGDGFGDIED